LLTTGTALLGFLKFTLTPNLQKDSQLKLTVIHLFFHDFLGIKWLEHQSDNQVDMIPRLRMQCGPISCPLYTTMHWHKYQLHRYLILSGWKMEVFRVPIFESSFLDQCPP
jgi:hypothetical protein